MRVVPRYQAIRTRPYGLRISLNRRRFNTSRFALVRPPLPLTAIPIGLLGPDAERPARATEVFRQLVKRASRSVSRPASPPQALAVQHGSRCSNVRTIRSRIGAGPSPSPDYPNSCTPSAIAPLRSRPAGESASGGGKSTSAGSLPARTSSRHQGSGRENLAGELYILRLGLFRS
jgi:hypothetical protein